MMNVKRRNLAYAISSINPDAQMLPEEAQSAASTAALITDALFSITAGGRKLGSTAELHLRTELSAALIALASASSPDLAEQARARADAVLSRDYSEAAHRSAASDGPWKLIVSEPVSPWTGLGAPTFILFHGSEYTSIDRATSVERLAMSVRHLSQQWIERPKLSIGDKVISGGLSSAFPQELANFMPEDENVPGNEHTLFYASYYLARIHAVSIPNLSRIAGPVESSPEGDQQALNWFIGHDLSHFAFDSFAYSLPGLSPAWVHGLRELLADLGGFLSLSADIPGKDRRALCHCYLAELLRYAMRDDGATSADALSARMQMGMLLFEPENRTWPKLLQESDLVHDLLSKLLDLALQLIDSRDAALLTHRLSALAARGADVVDRATSILGEGAIDDLVVVSESVSTSTRNRASNDRIRICSH